MSIVDTLPAPTSEPSSEGSSPILAKRSVAALASTKIRENHLEHLAIVYVRQSTPQQLVENQESLARQYALTNHARALGWASDRVMVIDEDLGLSGRSAEGRHGFQRLLAEVTMDHVGIVFGLEMSRLARSCKDWHHLLEVCAVFGTLLADQDGVYDPNDPNDRLLLGLRGTISEVELHTMRNRLERGKLHKAERGELFLHVPVGYVKSPTGGVELDPDEQVRSVVHLIFDKFDELGSGHALFRYLLRHNIRVGIRPFHGPNRGQVEWRRPTTGLLFAILKNPVYAGTYVYGRYTVDPKRRRQRTGQPGRRCVPMNEWKVTRHDCVPAFITWDRYLSHQKRLRENRSRTDSKGYPRHGAALLGGLLICGQCGCRCNVSYEDTGAARYDCLSYIRKSMDKSCRGLSAAELDTLVTHKCYAPWSLPDSNSVSRQPRTCSGNGTD